MGSRKPCFVRQLNLTWYQPLLFYWIVPKWMMEWTKLFSGIVVYREVQVSSEVVVFLLTGYVTSSSELGCSKSVEY